MAACPPLPSVGMAIVMNGVGQTARWTAAARARESARPDRLFDDPLSGLLAGEDGAALLRHFHTAKASGEGNPFLPIRTRWFDDFLGAAVDSGIRQVVGLGCGLDTRAFRMSWPAGTVLYEIDQESVLSYKHGVLGRNDVSPRCELRTLPVDLGEDWPESLLHAGFDPTARTVWFGEGVLFYLPEALAAKTLADAAALSAPGSRLAVDLIGTGIFRFPYMRPFLAKLAAADSPWQSATDDPGGFLADSGWTPDVVTEPGRPGADYGRWPNDANPPNLPDLPRSYLVSGLRR